MNNLIATGNTDLINTLDLRAKVNEFLKEAGERPVENSHFITRVEDELDDDLGLRKVFVNPAGGRPAAYYELTKDQALLVGMRESKVVRRKVLAWINKASEALKEETSVMRKLDEAMMLMKQDKDIASACGRGLFEWKEQRKIHMDRVDKLHKDVQILLNFGDSKNGQG